MKIALVYDAVYPYIKGGGEKRFYDFAKELTKQGHEIHIYGMKLWSGKNVIYQDGIYYHGLSKSMPLYTKENKRSIGQSLKFGLASSRMIKEDFDIIDSGNFPFFSLFPLRLISIFKGKRLFVTWHEVWGKDYWYKYLGKKGIFGHWIEKLSAKMPNHIVAVSEHTKRQLIDKLNVNPDKITVIPNTINYQDIQKIKPSKEKSDLIYVGRLLSHKNVDLLIKSVALMKKNGKNIKCMIVSDGPERNNLEKLSKELGVSKNIVFKGFVRDINEIYSLIKSSKVFVLPSEREGFGIVVLEANACGIPVITIKHKDNASQFLIKEGKNGYLAQKDEKDLIHKIEKAIKTHKSMAKSSKIEAEKYDITNVAKMLAEVYRE